jgi:hypothetical protein
MRHADFLSKHELYATGTTGGLIMENTGLPVTRMQSGPIGGDQQIGAMVASGTMDCIIFLRDPPHRPAPRAGRFRPAETVRRPRHPSCHEPQERRNTFKGAGERHKLKKAKPGGTNLFRRVSACQRTKNAQLIV